eukprot:568683-Ditylum_brightwellii.AAC.1
MLSPVRSTVIKAAKAGYLQGWPGFTEKAIRQHVNLQEETEKGHMKEKQQDLCSTKDREVDPIALPEQEQGNFKTNYVLATVKQIDGKVYSNQTGAFLRVSNRENRYVMIFYVYDVHFTKGIPIKSKKSKEYQKAYNDFYAELTTKGYKPTLHKLDNEVSRDVIYWIKKQQQATVKLAPPDMHCQNLSKGSIQTWKDHFTA